MTIHDVKMFTHHEQRKRSEQARAAMKKLWAVCIFLRPDTAASTRRLPEMPMRITTAKATSVTWHVSGDTLRL